MSIVPEAFLQVQAFPTAALGLFFAVAVSKSGKPLLRRCADGAKKILFVNAIESGSTKIIPSAWKGLLADKER